MRCVAASRAVGLALALVSVMTDGVAGQTGALLPFTVGIWGDDGALLPFAEFDGRRWRTPWPAPLDTSGQQPASSAPLPGALPAIDAIPTAWWGSSGFRPVWELIEEGNRRRTVRIVGTVAAGMRSSCSGNVGLETDVAPGTVAAAVAASRAGAIEPVRRLASGGAEWRTLAALLPDIYRRYEALGWRDVSAPFRPDLTAARMVPQLKAAFVSTDELGQFVYFESFREFPSGPEGPFFERSFIPVWLWRRSADASFQLVAVEPSYGDGEGKHAISFVPLGVVRAGPRRFWLGEFGGYAYAAAGVVDVRRGTADTILTVDYPGC